MEEADRYQAQGLEKSVEEIFIEQGNLTGEQVNQMGVDEAMSKIPPLSGTGSVRWTTSTGRLWGKYRLGWATTQTRLGVRDLLDSRIPI